MAEDFETEGWQKPDPLQILIEASDIVAKESLRLDRLLRELTKLIRKLVPAQFIAVFLRTKGGAYVVRNSVGFDKEKVAKVKIRSGEGLIGAAVEGAKTVHVNDVALDFRYIEVEPSVKAEIAVPLVARGRVVGVIDLQSNGERAFGPTEKAVLELLASRFSIAIEAARLHRDMIRQNETLRALAETAQSFSRTLKLEDLLAALAASMQGLVLHDYLTVYLRDASTGGLVRHFSTREETHRPAQERIFDASAEGRAAQTREPVLVEDTHAGLAAGDAPRMTRSEVAVPLINSDEVIGVLGLCSHRANRFSQGDVRTLRTLAPQLAASIANARLYESVARNEVRLERDLAAAREIQIQLLPEPRPPSPDLEIAAWNEPASEVSGDLYDFFPFPDGRFGVFVGDVSGKGAAAALYAGLVSGVVRELVTSLQTPAQWLQHTSETLLARSLHPHFVAAIFALWDPERDELIVGNSGQPRPMLLRPGGVESLDVTGVPLGLLPGITYDEVHLRLEPGETVVFVSDGITEATRLGEEFGDERLEELLATAEDLPPHRLIEKLLRAVGGFAGPGKRPTDDRTVVALRRKPR